MKTLSILMLLLSLSTFARQEPTCTEFFENIEEGIYEVTNSFYKGERFKIRLEKNKDQTLNAYDIFEEDAFYVGTGQRYQAGEEVWNHIWILHDKDGFCQLSEKPSPLLSRDYHLRYDEEDTIEITKINFKKMKFTIFNLKYKKI